MKSYNDHKAKFSDCKDGLIFTIQFSSFMLLYRRCV